MGADVRIEIEGSSAAPSPHVREPHRREFREEPHEMRRRRPAIRARSVLRVPVRPPEQDAPLFGRPAQEVDIVNVLEVSAVGGQQAVERRLRKLLVAIIYASKGVGGDARAWRGRSSHWSQRGRGPPRGRRRWSTRTPVVSSARPSTSVSPTRVAPAASAIRARPCT